MSEQPIPINASQSTDSTVAGRSLKFYWLTSRWFMIITVVLEIVAIIIHQVRFGLWIAIALAAILYTWILLRQWHVRLNTAVMANAVLGLSSGLVLAIFEIIWYRHWWYAMNLVRRPVMLAVAAIIVGGLFYLLFQSVSTKKSIKPKGGGMYGGTKTDKPSPSETWQFRQ